jgi:acyl carrier protein
MRAGETPTKEANVRTLEQQIHRIAAEELGIPPNRITWSARFRDLGADSFGIINLLVALEEKFKIEFPFDRVDDFDSLGGITELIQALSKSAGTRL